MLKVCGAVGASISCMYCHCSFGTRVPFVVMFHCSSFPHCLPVQNGNEFDLVVSGINRGDNAGLHVIYSGTVGAAREAACKVSRPQAFNANTAASIRFAC
jgi:hypothetical protein